MELSVRLVMPSVVALQRHDRLCHVLAVMLP